MCYHGQHPTIGHGRRTRIRLPRTGRSGRAQHRRGQGSGEEGRPRRPVRAGDGLSFRLGCRTERGCGLRPPREVGRSRADGGDGPDGQTLHAGGLLRDRQREGRPAVDHGRQGRCPGCPALRWAGVHGRGVRRTGLLRGRTLFQTGREPGQPGGQDVTRLPLPGGPRRREGRTQGLWDVPHGGQGRER